VKERLGYLAMIIHARAEEKEKYILDLTNYLEKKRSLIQVNRKEKFTIERKDLSTK
jgi:hypothetical protein